jgi:hypothetical protein
MFRDLFITILQRQQLKAAVHKLPLLLTEYFVYGALERGASKKIARFGA